MESLHERIRILEAAVEHLQGENQTLRRQLSQAEKDTTRPKLEESCGSTVSEANVEVAEATTATAPPPATTAIAADIVLPNGLGREHIERYSRQLLLADGFGVSGQVQLQSSAVLVIGAGGIGSTVLLYLAAAGVGRIGVVDYDTVEVSNLHRQVLHCMNTVGCNKAESACRAIANLNPTIACRAIPEAFTASNALSLVQDYDVVVDASDNPATRYLINDACVLSHKPLISGSAVGTQGQLTVCHYKGGPCYRCLYPKPAVQAGCASCSDAGVLGPVPGLIGVLQAMETLKVLTGNFGTTMHDRLLMYDGASCSFMSIKKPARRKNCPVCGDQPTIATMTDSHDNVSQTRGPQLGADGLTSSSCSIPTTLPSANNRASTVISCRDYNQLRESGHPHLLLDVRVEQQFAMCSLPGAVNIPLQELSQQLTRIATTLTDDGKVPIYCLCRRGIASAQATELLRELLPSSTHSVSNISGGLVAWQAQVDSTFPKY